MTKRITLLFLFLLACCSVSYIHAQRLYPVYAFAPEEILCKKCGYVDDKNNLKIAMTFCQCSRFYGGAAAVSEDARWGLISEKGKIILPIAFDTVYHLADRYFVAEKRLAASDSGFIYQADGKLIYKGVFSKATFYRPLNRIILQPGEKKMGKTDGQNKVAIFDSSFNELITYYSFNDLHADFVNIENPEKPSHDNTYFVLSETKEHDGKIETLSALYKKTGEKIFDSVVICQNTLLQYPGTVNQRATIIDSLLRIRIPFATGYKEIQRFCDLPLYAFTKDGKTWGIFDSSYQEVVPPIYQQLFPRLDEHAVLGMTILAKPINFKEHLHVFDKHGRFKDSVKTNRIDLTKNNEYRCNCSTELPVNQKQQEAFTGSTENGDKLMDNDRHIIEKPYTYLRGEGKYFIAGNKQANGTLLYGIVDGKGNFVVKPEYEHIEGQYSEDGVLDYFILSKKNKAVPEIFVIP